MRRLLQTVLVACLAATLLHGAAPGASIARAQTGQTDSFAGRIAALSEPGGYFDTDNLISNERSYLHVIPDLAAAKVRGGAYIGVGPDQNFSYIAQIRPSIAFFVDIRRDNMLMHLLLKALFSMSRTRVEYLTLLFARPAPEPIASWSSQSIDAIVAYVDGVKVLAPAGVAALRARVTDTIRTFGVPLSAADLETIDRFHRQFIADGLSLRFHSAGRAPQSYYPTYRDLVLETDLAGTQRSFLAAEEGFQFLKSLQARDLMIPVVGDLSGPSALAAIGRFLTARRESLSAFYASNVEYYLFRDGSFPRFVANLGKIPHTNEAVIIRSIFDGSVRSTSGYASVQLTQPIKVLLDGFAKGQFRNYWELAQAR